MEIGIEEFAFDTLNFDIQNQYRFQKQFNAIINKHSY